MSKKEWSFYIAHCKDNSFYVGIATDVYKRIKEHNKGLGAIFTKRKRPIKLVYFEKYPDQVSARKREIQVKNWSRIKKEKLISGFPQLRSG